MTDDPLQTKRKMRGKAEVIVEGLVQYTVWAITQMDCYEEILLRLNCTYTTLASAQH